MLPDRVVAIAADYADALLVFRRAQRTLLLLLVVMLLVQIAMFAAVHFNLLAPTAAAGATRPSAANWPHILHYVTVATLFLSMIFAAMLVLMLFATIHVMLVGRLIGVSYVARAFTLAIFVALLLVPWQSMLVTAEMTRADPVIPGVLYTWREIGERVPMAAGTELKHAVLYWARFVAMPLVALVMLLVVQVRSGRGLKLALGEEELLPLAASDAGTVVVR